MERTTCVRALPHVSHQHTVHLASQRNDHVTQAPRANPSAQEGFRQHASTAQRPRKVKDAIDIGWMMDGDDREGQTQREAFDAVLTTADCAETYHFDGVWLAERHFSPR